MSSPVGMWVDVPCENRGAVPSSREGSACVVYKDRLYVFGGDDGSTERNDLHEFNFSRKLWRVVPASGEVPIARSGHTCVVFKDALYVFGGLASGSRLNDLVEYNFLTQQWSAVVSNAASAPTPRSFHSAVVYGNAMYCFGGHSSKKNLKDFHKFDFETRAWSPVNTTGTTPQRRCHASLVVFKTTAILFGGSRPFRNLNDLHLFDFDRRMWSTVVVEEGPAPSPRRGHVAVVHSNAMYVFGGHTNTPTNDFHKLSLGPSERRTWHTITSDGTPPRECFFHTAAVYDSSLFVFGGRGNDNNFSQFRFEETRYIPDSAIPDSSFLSYLRSLVNNELTSDVTFVVEDAPIYAHRNLCMRCDYFKAMFTTKMLESRTREVVISDVSRPIFLSFLEYLYTDEVDEAVEDTMELMVVADRYGEDRLKSICESRILVSLCVENVATLFHAADQYKAAVLRDQCVSFMLKNFDVVSKTPAFEEMSHKNVGLVIELLKLR